MTGSEFRQLRRRAGLTQSELATRLHVHRDTIIRLEKQRKIKPSYAAHMREILRRLGCGN